jgi:hypothetical protein
MRPRSRRAGRLPAWVVAEVGVCRGHGAGVRRSSLGESRPAWRRGRTRAGADHGSGGRRWIGGPERVDWRPSRAQGRKNPETSRGRIARELRNGALAYAQMGANALGGARCEAFPETPEAPRAFRQCSAASPQQQGTALREPPLDAVRAWIGACRTNAIPPATSVSTVQCRRLALAVRPPVLAKSSRAHRKTGRWLLGSPGFPSAQIATSASAPSRRSAARRCPRAERAPRSAVVLRADRTGRSAD